MTPHIELIYFTGCPHVDAARSRLRAGLLLRQLPVAWREWDTLAASTPEEYRRYGSPTILIDGRDVADLPLEEGARCVAGGAPSLARLLAVLDEAGSLR